MVCELILYQDDIQQWVIDEVQNMELRNYLKTVTLSEAKGLAGRNKRFFAALRMTNCVLR